MKLIRADIDTPLGLMRAVSDDYALYVLDFADRRGLESDVAIIPGENKIIDSIKKELTNYFAGKCMQFKTPLQLVGTDFQKSVWHALQQIPCGETRSYLDIAKNVNNPKGFRAVARANGANQIAIVIPCHRVINNDGKLGGYGGGLARKEWLLNHEKSN